MSNVVPASPLPALWWRFSVAAAAIAAAGSIAGLLAQQRIYGRETASPQLALNLFAGPPASAR